MCGEVPMPDEPMLSWPGRARARATSSGSVRAGRAGITKIALGTRMTREIPTSSSGRYGIRAP